MFFIVLAHGAYDWYSNQPQEAGIDVPSGKLMSLSFAPFREGFSPLEKKYPLPEHVDEDLRLLADKTETIRTYSSLGGMEPTPELSRKYGLKMLQGAWIGGVAKENKKEIDALIQSANANPDVVKRVIVGNEVLLRGELDVDHLIEYIREVKKAVKQPVSYADVWSMYMKHPKLFAEVDFITIHILPYWEDEPIAVENAPEHLEKIVKQVEDEARGVAPGKPILIGESGWPSEGRQRGMAKPSVVNEAKFIRGMIQVANHHGFDYNIVEAFNQPWKSNLEGVVGANWGLISADRKPVFPLTGKVYENPSWLLDYVAATLLWLLLIAGFFAKLQDLSFGRQLLFLGLSQLLAVNLVSLAELEWYTSYSLPQRAYTVFIVLINSSLIQLLNQRFFDGLAKQNTQLVVADGIRKLYIFFILLALYKTSGLAINGRYLSFPTEQFAIPALGLIGLTICQSLSQQGFSLAFSRLSGGSEIGKSDHLLAYGLVFGFFGLIFGETRAFLIGRDFILAHPTFSEGLPFALSYTFNNYQLVLWLVWLLILALPFWAHKAPKA
ncbi:MAG: exo-beta-1,3-glucanase [Methylomonas sp.]